ncbi:hypothetical protein [Paludisphaera sp.]|uniref:hypothetical protein n=1 Tax=Paludisphaera sp. TaxID=2017432 RepID=UPI00301D7684
MLFDPCPGCGCETTPAGKCVSIQVFFCATGIGFGGNAAKAGVPVELYTNSTRSVLLDSGVTDATGRATLCAPATGTYYGWVPPYDVSTGGGHSLTFGSATTAAGLYVMTSTIDPAWLCAASNATCAGDPIRVLPRVLTLTDRFGTWTQVSPTTKTFYCVGEAESVFKLVPDPNPSGVKCVRVDGGQTYRYRYDYQINANGTVSVQRWFDSKVESGVFYPSDCTDNPGHASDGALAYSSCRGLFASGALATVSGYDPVGGTVVLSI